MQGREGEGREGKGREGKGRKGKERKGSVVATSDDHVSVMNYNFQD